MIHFRLVKAAIPCIVLFFLILQGCDKDESSAERENDMTLVAVWEVTKISSEYQGDIVTYTESQLDSIGFVWIFNIKDDGNIEQTTNIDGPLVTFQGTWETSVNQLTMNLTGPGGEDGTMVYEYAVDENILKLDWSLQAGTKFYAEFTSQE